MAGRLVTSADIKDGTVRSVDLHNHSVRPIDLAKQVTDRLGAVTGYKAKAVTGEQVAAGVTDDFAVSCPRGRVLLGASGYWLDDDRAPRSTRSTRTPPPSSARTGPGSATASP